MPPLLELLAEGKPNGNNAVSRPMDGLATTGAKKILAHTLELEVYIHRFSFLKDENGHREVVRQRKR